MNKQKQIRGFKGTNDKDYYEVLKQGKLSKTIFYSLLAISAGLLIPEIAFATASAKFDISAGIKGGTQPLIDAINEHWGKGVLLTGGASAFVGEGDARQRAIRAGIGCLASGGVVLALIAMLT